MLESTRNKIIGALAGFVVTAIIVTIVYFVALDKKCPVCGTKTDGTKCDECEKCPDATGATDPFVDYAKYAKGARPRVVFSSAPGGAMTKPSNPGGTVSSCSDLCKDNSDCVAWQFDRDHPELCSIYTGPLENNLVTYAYTTHPTWWPGGVKYVPGLQVSQISGDGVPALPASNTVTLP